MTLRLMQKEWIFFGLALFSVLAVADLACMTPPPNLTPTAVIAFRGTQVIQALDEVRDAAITLNAQTPPLVSTDTTRKIVTWHKATITIINSAPTGWVTAVQAALDAVPKTLAPPDQAELAPYFSLVKSLVAEATK